MLTSILGDIWNFYGENLPEQMRKRGYPEASTDEIFKRLSLKIFIIYETPCFYYL